MQRQGWSLLSILTVMMFSNSFAADGRLPVAPSIRGNLNVDATLHYSTHLSLDECLSSSCNVQVSSDPMLVNYDRSSEVDFRDLAVSQQPCGVTLGPLFSNPEFLTGDQPLAVATGDLNDDGAIDMVVLNYSYDDYPPQGGNISVLLSRGDGTFTDDVQYAVGDRPRSVAIGDLDGDGDLDLVVANQHNKYNTEGISLLLNRGDGTFDENVFIEGGDHPWSIAVGDLDGDGDLDLAVANAVGDNISVLLNNGNATFADHVLYAAGDGPVSIVIGDVDGDGDFDLATANFRSDNVSILFNNGDGTFVDATYFGNDLWTPNSIIFGDLDGDMDLDFAVVNKYKNSVAVHLNHGDGTYAIDVHYDTGIRPVSLAIGDLNSDGKPDLIVANANTDFDGYAWFDVDNISVLLNRGDGTFFDDITFEAGATPYSVAVDDLDGDGYLDVAVANLVGDSVSILRNINGNLFDSDVPYRAGDQPRSIAIGDLDGDGDLDLVVAIENPLANGGVSVLLNNGDGTYVDEVEYDTGRQGLGLAIGDLDGDNDLDIAVTSQYNVSVLFNQGDGTFADEESYLVGNRAISVVIGDLDGDEDLDLAVANQFRDNVSILLNLGNGKFAKEVLYDTGLEPRQLAIGDLDGDGDVDIASTTRADYGSMSVLFNRGNGTFEDFILLGIKSSSNDVVIGDLNNDGKLDLVFVHRPRSGIDNVDILFNLGGGTFSNEVSFQAGFDPSSLAIDDMDGDGDPDLVVTNFKGANISILRNLGDGTFGNHELYGVGDKPISVAIGDLDGDGDNDLATANYGDSFRTDDSASNVSVLLHMDAPDDDDDGLSNNCDYCPTSDMAGTIVIGPCDSGVPNDLDDLGCTMGDVVSACPPPTFFIQDYVDCVSAITNQWIAEGRIQRTQRKMINRCAYKVLEREATVDTDKVRRTIRLRSQR